MNGEDKALLRSLAAQLITLAFLGVPKPERYREAASLCDQVATRLRERADVADALLPRA